MNRIIKDALTILKKELRDTLRDRRTLMVAVLLPVIITPGLIFGIGTVMTKETKKIAQATVNVGVVGAGEGRTLTTILKLDPQIKLIEFPDIAAVEDRLKRKEISVGLVIADGFDKAMASEGKASVTVMSQSTNMASMFGAARIEAFVKKYSEAVVKVRLMQKNIDPDVLEPVALARRDVATKEERGGFAMGFFIPLMVVIWTITGGVHCAIDLSAGEKERATLEALLMAPPSRLSITMGKLLTVASMSMMSTLLSIAAVIVSFKAMPLPGGMTGPSMGAPADRELSFSVHFTTPALLIVFFVCLLLVVAFSGLLLSIGTFAKSFKEAQNLISPLYILVVMPLAVVNVIPDWQPSTWFYGIPGLNAALLFRELLVGRYVILHIAVVLGALALFASLCVAVTVKIFSREGVIARM
jgi:sodium transport system permease protein